MRIPICVLAGLFLASCGGGGNGSSTASSPPPASPSPSPASSSQSFSTINTEGVATVDSTGHVTIATQPKFVGGGTVTVNSDGSLVLNVNGQAPVPISNLKFSPTQLGTLEGGSGSAQAVTGDSLFAADGLSVSNYGIWTLANGPNSLVFGAVAGGQPTPVENLPKTGSAVYNGHTIGVLVSNGVASGLVGNATVNADFADRRVSTTFSNFQSSTGGGSATALSGSFTGATGTIGSANGGPYSLPLSGTLGGTAVSGTGNGQFHGPAAEETAGTWAVQGTGLGATGAFGAKRP